MSDILRRVTILAVNRASWGNLQMQVRTLFSSSGIGIDNFKVAQDQHIARFAPSLDAFKKRFVDSIEQSNAQIFTEDLRNMIMSTQNDQEIDTVIQALKKYSKNTVKFSDYHFGSPIMRLLYAQNKTNFALDLYMDESLNNIFNDSGSALVLMNKLIDEKRYDEAIKVFEYGSQRGFSTTSGRAFPMDVVMLAIEGLFRKNTKESLAKAQEIISKVRARDPDINSRTAAMVALLSIQQGEPSFAMEVLGIVRLPNSSMLKNIRAICYADMGRVEEAMNVVQLIAEQTPLNSERRVFPLAMRHIRMAAEKLNDTNLLTRFEDLSKTVLKNNRLSTTDISEFLCQPMNRRGSNRVGGQLNFRSNVQENRFRGGFNQQPNNFKQGNTDRFNRQFGGFNRENRFEYNNFQRQDSDYNRRTQNLNRNNYQRNENDRFPFRNRYSSFNENFRQEGRNQQQNQSFTRVNRTASESTARTRTGNPIASELKRNIDDA